MEGCNEEFSTSQQIKAHFAQRHEQYQEVSRVFFGSVADPECLSRIKDPDPGSNKFEK
jgi:hypothetical protein